MASNPTAGTEPSHEPNDGAAVPRREADPSAVRTSPRVGSTRRRRILWAVAGLGAVVVLIVFLAPIVSTLLNTVSTDDAYVNGHATAVAPRVDGQVVQVLVDDNMRVAAGQLLVQLDPEPYQVAVNQKKALVGVAEAKLKQAAAQVRALEATARGRRWRLQNAMEQVHNQTAALRAAVEMYESRRATAERARSDYLRAEKLFARGAVSREELDVRREDIRVAEAHAAEALARVQENRTALGLPAKPPEGKPLTDVPAELASNYSGVRAALADLVQSAAELGLALPASEASPQQVLDEFHRLDESGDINVILQKLVKQAPAYAQAEADLTRARRDLEQAELDLRYCAIVAEIDGVVSRRNVNPGNNVKAGQALMAIRSTQEIWVDANFKETQLADLVIGLPADIYVDMYGKHRVFKGRVSGFSMGTGSTLALLPPQNATGNFVKVVQRLPVRIDLVGKNPEDTPLFVGLSVVPYVDFKERPTGPDAGRRLQQLAPAPSASRAGESERAARSPR